jgi:hypothetical protein
MKLVKNFMRVWIASASVAGFVGGWAFLAHAGKPAPLTGTQPVVTQLSPLPTLEPLPPLEGFGSNLQPLPSMPQTRTMLGFPRLRTSGS